MYLHPLPPPPAAVDFSASLIPTSTSAISPSHLGKATQAREAVRSVLSTATSTAAKSSPSSTSQNGQVGAATCTFEVKLVSAIEEYLPHLVAIYNGTQTDELVWRGQSWFIWPALLSPCSPNVNKLTISSNSSSSLAKHGPFASLSLQFELDNVLILYSLALSNLALLQSIVVGNYEQSKTLLESQRKECEAILKRGLVHGKKAVEVIQWILTDLDAAESSQADGRQDWNQEWQSSKRRLLEALQVLHQLPPTLISLRLLLSPATCAIASAQLEPPPMPKGHPSPSLLAKLYLEVPRLAEEALALLHSTSGRSDGAGSVKRFFGSGEARGSASTSSNDPSKLASKFKRFGIRKGKKDHETEGAHRSVSPQDDSPSSTTNYRSRPAAAERSSFGNSSPLTSHPTYPYPSIVPVTSRIFNYLDSIASLYRSIAFKYLALSVGESGEDGQGSRHAEAVVFLRMAKAELEKLSDGPTSQLEALVGKSESRGMRNKLGKKDSSLSDQLEHPEAAEQKRTSSSHPLAGRLQSYHALVYSCHLTSVTHILTLYKRLNDSVSFQVMPSMADLYTKVPTPRGLLTFGQGVAGSGCGWCPPRAAFGSDRTGEEEGGQGFLITTQGNSETQGDYAGKGAYY